MLKYEEKIYYENVRRTLLNNILRGNVFQGQLVKISRNLPFLPSVNRNLPLVIRKARGEV